LSYGRMNRLPGSCRRYALVGVTGFEPVTYCSQSSCATRLRYTPISQAGQYYGIACPRSTAKIARRQHQCTPTHRAPDTKKPRHWRGFLLNLARPEGWLTLRVSELAPAALGSNRLVNCRRFEFCLRIRKKPRHRRGFLLNLARPEGWLTLRVSELAPAALGSNRLVDCRRFEFCLR